MRQPWPEPPEWSVLLHLGLSGSQQSEQVFEDLFENASEVILDGVIAQSRKQSKELWSLREAIPLANRAIGAICSFDISVPLSEIPNFISSAGLRTKKFGKLRTNCFGHLGDGNLHYNIFPPQGASAKDYHEIKNDLEGELHSLTHEMGGSISAEHGVGRLKVTDLERFCDPVKMALMHTMKKALDPLGILNPGAVLPSC